MCLGRVGVWLLGALALFASSAAQADAFQGSTRLTLGFGQRFEPSDDQVVFALGARGEALRVSRRRAWLRYGPAAELRTSGFDTFEAGAGFALTLDLSEDAVFETTTLLGGAYRNDRASSATVAQVLSVGFRDWDTRPRYASGLSLFLSARAALGSPHLVELTGGVELDLWFIASPFLQLRQRLRARRSATRTPATSSVLPSCWPARSSTCHTVS